MPSCLRHAVQARLPPDALRRLDDEGRGVAVVLIRVRLEPTVNRRSNAKVKRGNSFFVPNQRSGSGESSTSERTRRYLLRRRLLLRPMRSRYRRRTRALRGYRRRLGLETPARPKIVVIASAGFQQSLATDAAETWPLDVIVQTLEM